MSTRATPCLHRRIAPALLAATALAAGCEQDRGWPENPDPARWAAFEEQVPALVGGNTRFALDVYAQLAGDANENVFCSPLSISAALAMAYAGAGGQTEQEMAATLHVPLRGDRLHGAWASLSRTLVQGRGDGWDLRIANRLWGQSGHSFAEAFLALARDEYGAPLATADFAGDAETARDAINRWASDQTGGRITEPMPPGVLGPMTRLVLVNAIWFKGDWDEPFDRDFTSMAPFHRGGGADPVEVPLMALAGERFRYAGLEDVQVVQLPYRGSRLSMIIVLPRERDGLPSVEATLSPERLTAWVEGLRSTAVDVWLPRFEMRMQAELSDALRALGMTSAFEPGAADFSGMDDSGELFFSAVIHDAWVKVDEKGTEAAAVTALGVDSAAIPEEPERFRADHPFVLLIRDDRTGTILFMGRLADPSA